MEELKLWFEAMTTSQQIFWGCTIAGGLVFVIQTAMTLIGIDADHGEIDFSDSASDGDTLGEGGAMQLFSLRNLVNLILGYGLTGICLEKHIESTALLTLVALAVGIGFVFVFLFIYKKLLRLENHAEWKPQSLIGKTANVYLHIPAGGSGKIQVSMNGSVQEFDATSKHDLPSGTTVKIIELNDRTFVVESL